jgi:flavin-dependent dehydrogenase
MREKMYDVIVVGAGPAGSTAAKKCAEQGLKTLILEKRGLPRDKVCSGMIMGPLAHTLLKEEFGDIPEEVSTQPPQLSGYCFHVPGIGSEKLDNFTPLTWRRDLDYWMSQRAQAGGAEIWQAAEVVNIEQREQAYSVAIEKDKNRQELETKFLVGADGATSVVREFLFPDLKTKYAQVVQEHYQGDLDLDKNYIHWFYPVELIPASFTAHQKDGLIVLDVGGRPGQAKELMVWAKKYLAENHGLNIGPEPVWRGGCLEPALYRELTSHIFNPARGNALLVGDAAGLLMPVSGEGIGLGMKSALLAASSIARAISQGEPADSIYLSEISGMNSFIGEIYPLFRRIIDEAKSGGHSLPQIIRDAYQSTLRAL